MKLQEIYNQNLTVSFSELAHDPELVRQIQSRLKDLGLPVGQVDGLYGSATASALSTFIKAFGESDAQITKRIAELLIEATSVPGYDWRQMVTPEIVRAIVNCPLSDAKTYLPGVLSGLHERGILDKLTSIAAIATIGVETGGFRPIHEFGGQEYFDRMYGHRCSDLGNCHPGDGAKYHGRGFIQLTGRANYRNYGKKLGVDLEDHPDLALDPVVSARVLALYFDERGVDDAARSQDWHRVRKLVNGGYNGLEPFMNYVEKAKARIL